MAQIVVRTRFLDDALLRAVRTAHQVVIVAAGMDARAYRLAWPDGAVVYELDQPAVIAAKNDVLADDDPRCRRVAVGVDLADDWPTALTESGFDPNAPTVWLIEGLLQYLDEARCGRCSIACTACRRPGRPCCTTSSARRCSSRR